MADVKDDAQCSITALSITQTHLLSTVWWNVRPAVNRAIAKAFTAFGEVNLVAVVFPCWLTSSFSKLKAIKICISHRGSMTQRRMWPVRRARSSEQPNQFS